MSNKRVAYDWQGNALEEAEYEIAFAREDGGMDVVGKFYANDDNEANFRMENDLYLLKDGRNINGHDS